MGEYILFSTIVILGVSIFGFIYDIYISIKEDKLRGKNSIIVKWPKIMAIICMFIFLGIGGTLIALAITELRVFVTIIVIVLVLIVEVPLAILILYFCRHRYYFDFESKKITVFYALKKKKIYLFDEIKEIVVFPQTLDIYFLKDKKVIVQADMIGTNLLPDIFKELGFTVIKKERYR